MANCSNTRSACIGKGCPVSSADACPFSYEPESPAPELKMPEPCFVPDILLKEVSFEGRWTV